MLLAPQLCENGIIPLPGPVPASDAIPGPGRSKPSRHSSTPPNGREKKKSKKKERNKCSSRETSYNALDTFIISVFFFLQYHLTRSKPDRILPILQIKKKTHLDHPVHQHRPHMSRQELARAQHGTALEGAEEVQPGGCVFMRTGNVMDRGKESEQAGGEEEACYCKSRNLKKSGQNEKTNYSDRIAPSFKTRDGYMFVLEFVMGEIKRPKKADGSTGRESGFFLVCARLVSYTSSGSLLLIVLHVLLVYLMCS